jgi:hypothetical protein
MRQTNAKKEAFCEAIASGLRPEEAARSAGITRSTAYRWRDESPEFVAAWADAELRSVEEIESVLFTMAKEKDLGAVCFFLKSRKPERYNRKYVTLAGDADAPITGQVWIYPKKAGKP